MQFPEIIFLNGSSCSGKTSIARLLQERLPEPYFRMGCDDFSELAPPRWTGHAEGWQFVPQPDGTVPVRMGAGGLTLANAFHATCRAIVDSGLRLVIDEVLVDQ